MQALAKSKKLRDEENDGIEMTPLEIPIYKREATVKIKPIETANDWLLVMPFAIESTILLPNQTSYRSEGIVIGVSQTIMANDGQRVGSCFKPGDVVVWHPLTIVQEIKREDEPYKGRIIVALTERAIMCRGNPIKYEIV